MSGELMTVFSKTDKGPREQNQDYFEIDSFSERLYLMIADGVGGNRGGQTASRTACEVFFREIKNGSTPREAINKTHEEILELASKTFELTGMATTFTCLVVDGSTAYGVHSGDSRIYLLRGNGVKQITEDHSEVAKLLSAGRISKSEASTYPRRNVLYSALGVASKFTFQEFDLFLNAGDRVLLMTDGAYSVVSKLTLRDTSLCTPDFLEYCNKVVEKVVEGQTKDNYTLVGYEHSG
jgi:protein phosphatase